MFRTRSRSNPPGTIEASSWMAQNDLRGASRGPVFGGTSAKPGVKVVHDASGQEIRPCDRLDHFRSVDRSRDRDTSGRQLLLIYGECLAPWVPQVRKSLGAASSHRHRDRWPYGRCTDRHRHGGMAGSPRAKALSDEHGTGLTVHKTGIRAGLAKQGRVSHIQSHEYRSSRWVRVTRRTALGGQSRGKPSASSSRRLASARRLSSPWRNPRDQWAQ